MEESGNKSLSQEFLNVNFSWPNFLPHANFSFSEKENSKNNKNKKFVR